MGEFAKAETNKNMEITKEEIFKEPETNTISFKAKIKNLNEEICKMILNIF